MRILGSEHRFEAGVHLVLLDELAAAGVKRISLATSLYRAAMTGFLNAISEVKNSGNFQFVDNCASCQELLNLMSHG